MIRFGDCCIGSGQPCFIIAEAGVNHNGDPALARRLIAAAHAAGADAVKFQTWITEKIAVPQARTAEYQKTNLGGEESQFAMLKKLELGYAVFTELKAEAERSGILFLSTPDEEDSCDFLDRLGVPLFKIGSGEITNLPYLRHVARKGKPVILSTGMATLGEVECAVRAMEEQGNRQLVLLHCVSSYPAAPADCNLRAMETLRLAFGYPVGFSDHTLGRDVAVAAVALGACVLEKHFTLDVNMEGPDHRASLDPSELVGLVKAVRQVESAMGDGAKRPSAAELTTRAVVQKVYVAARDLRAGELVREDCVALRRSSAGLPAAQWPLLRGRRLKQAVVVFSPITPEMLE